MTTGGSAPFFIKAEPGTISLEGKITSLVTGELMDAYLKTGGQETVSLDFSRTGSLDVSGINSLLKLQIRAKSEGRKIKAKGLSKALQEVFITTGIDEAIPMDGPAIEEKAVEVPAGWPWARPVKALKMAGAPVEAVNLVDGLKAVGPVQGFGRLWEKTYQIRLPGVSASPKEVLKVFRENFPTFQPEQNRFYPSPAGIMPGEIVLINASTPAGPIYTGVLVLYVDDESFTFMTPEGHPEAGWVSFTTFEDNGVVIAQVQGFARASDPLYEMGFEVMGSREQEKIWKHVLVSLAKRFGVENSASMHKTCVAGDYQWARLENVCKSAQLMTMNLIVRKTLGI